MDEYPQEWVDGVEVSPRRIDHDETVAGRYRGSIVVGAGATLRLVGQHQGSLYLETGSAAAISGQHQGSIHVADGARLVIESRQQGSLHVDHGGVAAIASGGACQGSIHIFGILLNEGSRGGREHGDGEVHDRPGSRVVRPVVRDGATHYEW